MGSVFRTTLRRVVASTVDQFSAAVKRLAETFPKGRWPRRGLAGKTGSGQLSVRRCRVKPPFLPRRGLHRPWPVLAWLLALGCGQPAATMVSPPVETLDDRVAALAASPAPPREEVEALQTDIVRCLDRDRSAAERCLALLLRLPRFGTAPTPPNFPFDGAAARRYQQEYAGWLGVPVEFVNGEGLTLVLVPPGTFLMGSPDDEPGHNAGGYDESRHAVTLTRPFYLGQHEVTVGPFRRFVQATGHVTDGEKNGGGHAHDDRAVWQHRPGTNWRNPGYAGPYQ